MDELVIPLKYELYLQDLSTDYMSLTYLGYTRTIEEARSCCKLFKESKNLTNSQVVIFRPVLEE